MTDADTELELKLAVRSHEPAVVLARLAELRTLRGGLVLVPRSTLRIRDQYLTLPPGDAGSERIALRRRRKEEAFARGSADPPGAGPALRLLTLKGEDQLEGVGGVSRRFELERPDDADGEGDILAALAERGWHLETLAALPEHQRRMTLRRRRAVYRSRAATDGFAAGSDGSNAGVDALVPRLALAELVLDTVTLAVAGETLRFHEVEIEAATGSGATKRMLEGFRDALLDTAAALPLPADARLVPWPLSKLETGLRLKALLAGGEPETGPDARDLGRFEDPPPPRDLRPEELDRLLEMPAMDKADRNEGPRGPPGPEG